MKAVRLSFFALSLVFCLSGCFCVDDDHTSPSPCAMAHPYFDINGMQVSLVQGEGHVPTDPSIQTAPTGLRLEFTSTHVAVLQQPISLPFYYFNAAYARQPCPPNGYRGSKEEAITDISVVTLKAYDADHPAGSELNDILRVSVLCQEPELLEAYVLRHRDIPVQESMLEMYFDKMADSGENLELEVTVKLSTGEEYVAQTADSLPE